MKNIFSIAIALFLMLSCSEDSEVQATTAPNSKPVAHAGADVVLTIASGSSSRLVTLDGSASSDSEGALVSYQWTLDTTVLATTRIADVTLEAGIHIIVLTVTDADGATDTDTIRIELKLQPSYAPIDTDVSNETKQLYKNLAAIANGDQFVFGQEFPLSFQLNSIRHDLSTSDCKDVTGDHPGVYGIDPHYMLYKTEQQRQTHIAEAQHAYANGSIVTFDFHQESRTDHKIYYNDITSETDKSLMYDIVNELNGSRDWFYDELDQILEIINNDLGFPIVFRLYHEMDGGWFWWGTNTENHSTQLYKDFYRLTVDYIKNKTNLVLFAWSPNSQFTLDYYPGDAYVDVVGFDIYEPTKSELKEKLIALSSFATERNKVAILAETGNRNNYIINEPTFWTSTILGAIEEGGSSIKIAWVLSWFNAPWVSSQSDLFIPNSVSATNAKNDFLAFKNNELTLFQEDVKAMNVYE